MSIKKIVLFFILFVSISGFSQEAKADRLFKKGDFIKAAEFYEQALVKNRTQHVLQQLAECYYNTYQYNKGITAMKALVQGEFVTPKDSIKATYHFMYYQLLSTTGDYEQAIEQLALYKSKIGQPVPNIQKSIEKVETLRLKNAAFMIDSVNFNSDASDYAAFQHNDSVYFSSDRKGGTTSKEYNWTHRPFLDLYVVPIDSLSKGIGDPTPMPKIINSELHEGSIALSKDGKTMYFSRSNLVEGKKIFTEDNKNQVQLYTTHKVNGKWISPKKLPFCSNQFNYQHPALSPDGKTLYYSSDTTGSLGSYDIFSISINDDETFGTPLNLGATINTANREQYPYISEEGNLFFASNGHLGLGLLDIFVSELKNESFSTPINLGAPINSRYDDFSFMYGSKKTGFFSSNRDDANDNIYAFKKIEDIFLREYVNLFEIKDSVNGDAILNSQVILKNKNGKVVYENMLDDEGAFVVNLLPGNYTIEMSAFGYKSKVEQIEILETNNSEHILLLNREFVIEIAAITKNISAASKEVITKLITDNTPPKILMVDGKFYLDVPYIYFDFNRWQVREDSKILLNNLIYKLMQYPSIKIRVKSHTDNSGTAIYNQVLSEKRAQSTRDYLVKVGGLDPTRVSFKGYGESNLLINCKDTCSEKDHQKNRRSQFEIIEY